MVIKIINVVDFFVFLCGIVKNPTRFLKKISCQDLRTNQLLGSCYFVESIRKKKKNNFFIFDFIMKNVKESKMYKKITYFLKLFNFYIKN